MHNLKLTVWILAITLIESMFGKYISIGNIMPDLLYVFVLCYAFGRNDIKSVIAMSVMCGAIADCLSSRIFGTNLAIFLLIAVIVRSVKENVFNNNILVLFLFVLVFSLFGKSVFYVTNISVLKDMGYLHAFFGIILPEAVYNTCTSIIIYPLAKLTLSKRSGLYQ